MTAPARDGAGAARAMRAALRDAAVSPHQVDFVTAHGTGTVYNDAWRCPPSLPCSARPRPRLPVNRSGARSATLGAAGSFEPIMCAQVLRVAVIPPTAGCEQLDPACALDVVRGAPRQQPVRIALSTSSAFAGNNAAIVLRRM
jgi:3-oxoacyl-[acyl-carrier-protein] synthase II